jgi:hypothetical protein
MKSDLIHDAELIIALDDFSILELDKDNYYIERNTGKAYGAGFEVPKKMFDEFARSRMDIEKASDIKFTHGERTMLRSVLNCIVCQFFQENVDE